MSLWIYFEIQKRIWHKNWLEVVAAFMHEMLIKFKAIKFLFSIRGIL